MTLQKRLMQRFAGAGALATLMCTLAACGRVEPAALAQPQATSAPAAATSAPAVPTAAELPTVVVAGEAAGTVPTVAVPDQSPVPVPASPALQPALSGGQVQFAADFATNADLSAWTFTDIFQDPAGAPEWSVNNGRLVAPFNNNSLQQFADVLAVTGPAQAANYSFEVNALSRTNSVIGVVVAYTDPKNYVALLLADAASPNAKPGLRLVQRTGDTTTLLAAKADELLQTNHWYSFAVQVSGSQITATVDGKQLFSAAASGSLGQKVGLYAGSEGGALFSTARLTLN